MEGAQVEAQPSVPRRAVNGTVHPGVRPCPPRRTSNAAKRLREYLATTEVEQLVQAAPVPGCWDDRVRCEEVWKKTNGFPRPACAGGLS